MDNPIGDLCLVELDYDRITVADKLDTQAQKF